MSNKLVGRLVGGIVIFFLLASLTYLTGPWMRWLWFHILYMNTGFWIIFTVGLIATFFAMSRVRTNDYGYYIGGAGLPIFIGLLFLGGLIFYMIWAPAHAQATLAKQTKAEAMSSLPETTSVRYVPMDVAKTVAENKLSDSRYDLGELNPIEEQGEVNWVAPRIPHGAINKYKAQTGGVAVIGSDLSLKEHPAQWRYGEGMMVTDNLKRQLQHRNYWADTSDTY